MAKRTSSIHIENNLWEYIAEFQRQNDIDSRNTAIEWILVEHRLNHSKSFQNENTEEINNIQNKAVITRETDLILEQIENDMPD